MADTAKEVILRNGKLEEVYPVTGSEQVRRPDGTSAEDALAEKQDKTDDSLKTTDKTVAGAVNEIYDDMIVAVEFTEEDIDKLWQK